MKEFLKEIASVVLVVLFFLLIIGAVIGGAYWVANSDLPDWFKFWILK